ncbi:PepSY-associated TM helix domain-containing protein [Pseudoduganella albidiflava]|uniref:PepSY domain-containing protein n=1 Tax=Pseudoduganella albidiflava TaxID=321983 RepID=A0A411X028_9BURK|nr:PepSY-associated TM helix domain-containing protein [Pseudoduganella albidiflava]QBI02367.1 PepSY domain-containing protein [Pseudoduganella albidiflava]GGY43384.1 peptidase [Pseudoduganella albidiflava]
MRSELIRTYKSLHTWTGIVAGMALFIAFYAGALTVFKEPLSRWATPPGAHGATVPLGDAPALIAATLAVRPAIADRFRLDLVAEGNGAGGMRLSWDESDGSEDDHDRGNDRHFSATLAPDGSVRVAEQRPAKLAEFLDVLHRVVGLPYDTDPNRWVMGVVAALYALALISGVVVLLPTLAKDFFALRLGRNLKRMWLDAHNVIGIVSLPFHVIMALTATVFAFHDGLYAAQDAALYDGKIDALWRAGTPKPPRVAPDPASLLAPAELVARARAAAPGFEPVALHYARVGKSGANVRVWGRAPTDIARTPEGGFILMDPYTGKIGGTDYTPGLQPGSAATLTSFFALHFASFGGPSVAWAYFVLGLAGAFLFYTGNLLWVESRRRSERAGHGPVEQRRATRWMAAATVGVCLGCICAVSLAIAAAKGLHGVVADPGEWHRLVYYTVFLGAVAWSFVAGAARAGVHLLWGAAIATALIPALSLAAWLVPGTWWVSADTATLAVDLVAGAGALAFAAMARRTGRRVAAGRSDSVWAASRPGMAA